jgi:uncharacterized membrane protein (GlpM family)
MELNIIFNLYTYTEISIMGEGLKLLIYFLVGGSILTMVTYFGSKDKGILAAFIAMFPAVTTMSIITIYSESGSVLVLDYVRGLLLLSPVWIVFLLCVYFFLPKQGLVMALAVGTLVYILVAILLIYLQPPL